MERKNVIAAGASGGAAGRAFERPTPTGRKGTATRPSLMTTARRLLDRTSALGLSAAAISKEAGTSPGTFYAYFEDVEDILWSVCDEIGHDTSKLFPEDFTLRSGDRLDDDALAFVRGYSEIWACHGPLLLYRNMEADRGNRRFNQLVLRNALPILKGLTERLVEAAPPDVCLTRSDANAEAVVLIAAIDRIAAALHTWPRDSLTPDILLRAQARTLARMLQRPRD